MRIAPDWKTFDHHACAGEDCFLELRKGGTSGDIAVPFGEVLSCVGVVGAAGVTVASSRDDGVMDVNDVRRSMPVQSMGPETGIWYACSSDGIV